MNDSSGMRGATTHTGPLGSSIHVIRADADTVAELASIDWNRHFRRVCLDPVRGLATLMSPSHPHEDLSTILDDVVSVAGSILTGAAKNPGSLRIRGQGEPPGTGMEPDCACYVGERAKGYFAVDGVRFGETDDERKEAVARIVRRRQRMSLRVREEGEAYPA